MHVADKTWSPLFDEDPTKTLFLIFFPLALSVLCALVDNSPGNIMAEESA